jgi:uncharacterized OB-fold protein
MVESVIKHFYTGLENGVLLAARCAKCSHLTFPPTTACEKCGSFDVSDAKLSGKGTLQFLSHGTAPPPNPRFNDIAPYAYGHIVLEEGVWVQAIVRGVDTDPKTMRQIYDRGPTKVVLDILRTDDLPVMAFRLAV